jgi:hypothetical protein
MAAGAWKVWRSLFVLICCVAPSKTRSRGLVTISRTRLNFALAARLLVRQRPYRPNICAELGTVLAWLNVVFAWRRSRHLSVSHVVSPAPSFSSVALPSYDDLFQDTSIVRNVYAPI